MTSQTHSHETDHSLDRALANVVIADQLSERVADRWRNRRRMAWWSLVSGLLFPVLLLLSPVACATLSAIAGPFYLFVGAVVGAYIGFATVDDKWQGYGRTQPPSSPRTAEEPYAPAAQFQEEPFPQIQPIDRRKYEDI